MKTSYHMRSAMIALILILGGLAGRQSAQAHCDTMDGPVVIDAQKALKAENIAPVLKWIVEEDEPEINEAFAKTLKVRKQSVEARELADRYFFETLVRVHRASEGAPFTGLKPAGMEVEDAILLADQALESGDVKPLVKALNAEIEKGLHERFLKVIEKKKHADDSPAAGREFVAAYVDFIHYAEGLHQSASVSDAHHKPDGQTTKHEAESSPHNHDQH